MTISSPINRVDFIGAGSTDTFGFSFKILDQTDLLVTEKDTSDIETTLVLGIDYTVALNANGTGSIVLIAGNLTVNHELTIRRVRPLTQETDIRNQGDFFPETHEDAFDHMVMISQQQQDEISRSLKLPETTSSTDFDPTLPTEMEGAIGKSIVTNATGTGFIVGPGASEIANAEASAINAASSAASALTSETNAATSETNASASETNSAASATAAQAAVASAAWNDVEFKTFADSPITIVDGDSGTLFSIDCSGGDIVVNLPLISTLTLTTPWVIAIKKTDLSGNEVTVNRNSPDLIDGNATFQIQSADSGAVFVPDIDPSPDAWTTAVFGAITGDLTIDEFSGTGAQTDFTLSVAPGSENNTQVYISGVYQQKNTYTVVGTTISFAVAPPSGTDNIEVVIGTTVSIGTPGSNTVATPQLVDLAVTNTKIANGAVNSSKLDLGAVGNINVRTETTTYNAVNSDHLILCDSSGGAFTVNLFSITGNGGKRIILKKTTDDFNAVTIDASGAETIDGSLTTTIDTLGEVLELIATSSGWEIVRRHTATKWIDRVITGSWTGGATYTGKERRIGSDAYYDITVDVTGAITPVLIQLIVNLPAGREIDTAQLSSSSFLQPFFGSQVLLFDDSAGSELYGAVHFTGLFSVQPAVYQNNGFFEQLDAFHNTDFFTKAVNDFVNLKFSVPIVGWNA